MRMGDDQGTGAKGGQTEKGGRRGQSYQQTKLNYSKAKI